MGGSLSRENLLLKKQKLTSEAQSIKSELNALYEKESTLRATHNRRKPELDDLMDSVRLYKNEPKLTCKMADIFVEKIVIHDKWQIEIRWKSETIAKEAISVY